MLCCKLFFMKLYEPPFLPGAGTNEEAMFAQGQEPNLVTSAREGQCWNQAHSMYDH